MKTLLRSTWLGILFALIACGPGRMVSQAHAADVIRFIDVTLSTDTSAYANNDLIADAQQIDQFFSKVDGTARVVSFTVTDEDDQKAILDLYLVGVSTSWGAENGAPGPADATVRATQCYFSFAAADYKDLGGADVAQIKNLQCMVKAVAGTDDLYIAAVTGTSTPTYTASGVKVRIGIVEE